jgi:succinoglycan biosynthesis protein ExoV
MRLVHFRGRTPNFGDDLNANLWPALAPCLFERDDAGHGFVGIGTIFGMDVGDMGRLDVFSSGAGNDPVGGWADKQVSIRCVRGPMTAHLLGVDPALAITDGAILVPLVPAFPNRASDTGTTVVIPHFETIAYPGWQEACRAAGFELLDPRGEPGEVIAAIASAKLVLTESLHGAIVADVYGVPWNAFAVSGNFGTSKWVDWLATLGLDFTPTLVPPPNVMQLLDHGRRSEPYGTRLRFSLERALGEFRERIAPVQQHRLRALAKSAFRRALPLHAVLGFSPVRTAEALTRLAREAPLLSEENRRQDLRDHMMDTLRRAERELC